MAGPGATVQLNCDMGESYGMWTLGDDEAVMPHIALANVACGFHGGDPTVMRATVASAKANGVKVGAHPSYPDLQGFGRRAMAMDPEELTAALLYQIGALKAFLDAEDRALNHVKPHGALYGAAARDEAVANAVADAVAVYGVPVLGMAGTKHEEVYTGRGLGFLAEYYADLEYDDDGSLIITRRHEAYDAGRVAERVRRVVQDGIAVSRSGKEIPMRADLVCIHTDTPGAPELARAVHDVLSEHERSAWPATKS
jgi:5-oxoprolinase (ATP-hydrolysing) subunit A